MEKTQALRKPVESRRALQHRQKTLALGIFLALGIAGALAMLLVGCGGGSSAPVAPPPTPAVQALQIADVQNIVQTAVNSVNADIAVAVVDRAGFGLGVLTGKADVMDSNAAAVNPGGVPIFYKNVVLGGIGVVSASSNLNVAEFAAFAGATAARSGPADAFGPTPAAPGVVVIGGISLPFVNQTSRPAGFSAGPAAGTASYVVAPANSQGQPPDGDLIAPAAGPLGGLSAADVKQILDNAEATANTTRTAIRLPPGSKARMVIAVADLDGTMIGLRRMPDATVFSIDVAATKARNMVYFNSASRTAADLNGVPMGTAVTNRTISFGSQPLYPPGIDGSSAGPFFNLFTMDLANPCTQGFQSGAANSNKSGIVFFPGSAGLFRNGALVGGLGVSGDGVDQDDYVTNGGIEGFEAPAAIRADQVMDQGVRLPYFKFPRNPTN